MECNFFMDLSKSFNTKESDFRTHVLKLLKNLYGHNQAGRVWNHHPNDALRMIWFKKSAVNECVWYRDKTILFYCVDYIIFMGPEPKYIDKAIEDIEKEGLDIEDKVNIQDYLRVNI